MAATPISPIPPILASVRIEARPGDAGARQVRIGELLSLLLTQGADGALLGKAESGLRLPLPAGLGMAGETLLMRVQSLLPRLELQLVKRDTAAPQAPSMAPSDADVENWPDGSAMRTDQALLLRQRMGPAMATAMAMPGAAEQLATRWRSQAQAEQMRSGAMSAGLPPGAEREGAGPVAAGIPLQGWMGQALWLRLLSPQLPALGWTPGRDDEEEGASRQPHSENQGDADEAGEGLRLGLILSLNGDWVQVVLQWQRGGLLLHLSSEKPDTLQLLRGLLPRISAALAAVPLPVRHCQLSSRPPAMPPLPKTQQGHGLAHASSGPLFRAGAEIANVLQQQR